jgi:hypothetical protein
MKESDVISWFAHAGITAVTGLIGLLLGNLYVGLAAGVFFYLGREVAQHERKERGSHPARGFYVWNWSLDAVMDLLFPILAAVILIAVFN